MEDIGNDNFGFKVNGDVLREIRGFLMLSDDDFSPERVYDIKEEMVEEFMQELLIEINGCNVNDDKCVEDSSMGSMMIPPVDPLNFMVAKGGNESCGATFSDLASTVMAGIDGSGMKKGGAGSSSSSSSFEGVRTTQVLAGVEVVVLESLEGIGPAWLTEESESTGECCMQVDDQGGVEKIDGGDAMEVDDEWLARVLSSGPLELEEWV